MAGVCQFNATDLDIVPLVVNRELISYTHPIILTQITDPANTISPYAKHITQNLVFGAGATLDFATPNFEQFKSSKMYFLDLRKTPDVSEKPITVVNQGMVPTWVQNLIFNTLIESVRGLIVLYDDPTVIPDVFWSRSLLTLTDSTDLKVIRNILNRAGPGLATLPVLSGSVKDKTFRGCLKGIHWTKIVTT